MGSGLQRLRAKAFKHRSSKAREMLLLRPNRPYPDLSSLNTVAVSLYELFAETNDRSSCQPRFQTAGQLRSALRCRPDCRLIVSGVDDDWRLELFWQYLEHGNLAQSLTDLNIDAVTIPNFSFFTPMPEEHARYNIRRMQIVASQFSSAGLKVVPHIHATKDSHWRIWTDFLSAQQQITHVCVEFQTGCKQREQADAMAYRLMELQEQIGRSLSLIIVAGRQHIDLLRRRFERISLIDSQVMMKSVNSRKALVGQNGKLEWSNSFVAGEGRLERLFRENLITYTTYVERLFLEDPVPVQGRLSLFAEDWAPAPASHVA